METELLYENVKKGLMKEVLIACELYNLVKEEYGDSEDDIVAIPWVLFEAGRLYEQQQGEQTFQKESCTNRNYGPVSRAQFAHEAFKDAKGRCKRKGLIMTNGDLIRNMSNVELAVTLMCPNEMGMTEIKCDRDDKCNCCKCLYEWLKQPVSREE